MIPSLPLHVAHILHPKWLTRAKNMLWGSTCLEDLCKKEGRSVGHYSFSHSHGSRKWLELKGNCYWRDTCLTFMIMGGRLLHPKKKIFIQATIKRPAKYSYRLGLSEISTSLQLPSFLSFKEDSSC